MEMKKKGRKPYEVTEELRSQVRTLAGYGLSMKQIGDVIGMDRNTVAKHFEQDIEKGKSLAFTQATNALFSNIKKGKEASIFFYLKTQWGWKETQKTELSAEIQTKMIDGPPQETRAEWEKRIEMKRLSDVVLDTSKRSSS